MPDQHPSVVVRERMRTFLVVDDTQIRQLAAKLLRVHGHRVSVARDGREMRHVLDTAAIDLVILDMRLLTQTSTASTRSSWARTSSTASSA